MYQSIKMYEVYIHSLLYTPILSPLNQSSVSICDIFIFPCIIHFISAQISFSHLHLASTVEDVQVAEVPQLDSAEHRLW